MRSFIVLLLPAVCLTAEEKPIDFRIQALGELDGRCVGVADRFTRAVCQINSTSVHQAARLSAGFETVAALTRSPRGT